MTTADIIIEISDKYNLTLNKKDKMEEVKWGDLPEKYWLPDYMDLSHADIIKKFLQAHDISMYTISCDDCHYDIKLPQNKEMREQFTVCNFGGRISRLAKEYGFSYNCSMEYKGIMGRVKHLFDTARISKT